MAVLELTPYIRREIEDIVDKRIREVHVTKEDFSELKGIVRELAIIQKESEKRLRGVEIAVSELAEAQKRTETRVEELAIAQKELAEAQKRTETRVEELAIAQKETQKEISELTKALERTNTNVGGIGETMGY
ncbi:MAG: hypothetical protein AB1630_00600, partial [bacterium]